MKKKKTLRRKRLHICCMYCLIVFFFIYSDEQFKYVFTISWDPTYQSNNYYEKMKNRKEERSMYDVYKISIFYLFHSLTSKFVV